MKKSNKITVRGFSVPSLLSMKCNFLEKLAKKLGSQERMTVEYYNGHYLLFLETDFVIDADTFGQDVVDGIKKVV